MRGVLDEAGFSTKAVHGARVPEVTEEPASVPIYQTATWRFDSSEAYAEVLAFERQGHSYGRGYGNPPWRRSKR